MCLRNKAMVQICWSLRLPANDGIAVTVTGDYYPAVPSFLRLSLYQVSE